MKNLFFFAVLSLVVAQGIYANEAETNQVATDVVTEQVVDTAAGVTFSDAQ